jgi:hypothetical protein
MSRFSGSCPLDKEASDLLRELLDSNDSKHGFGTMTTAIYDTAWVAIVAKPGVDSHWLFPECFQFLLEQQQEDGGWATYASEVDGILNTLAALLALKRHANFAIAQGKGQDVDMDVRMSRAITYLESKLQSWDVSATLHVGFEYLTPSLLRLLEAEGVFFNFAGREILMKINAKKMSKFRPEMLYGPMALTALHSLEAFVGVIDFDKVRHHKVRGSMMASHSSTAAYIMNTKEWDEEAEEYLRHVVAHGHGKGNGGVPSAFPSTLFETTWVSTCLVFSLIC